MVEKEKGTHIKLLSSNGRECISLMNLVNTYRIIEFRENIRGEVRSQKGLVRKWISGLMQSPWWAPKGA